MGRIVTQNLIIAQAQGTGPAFKYGSEIIRSAVKPGTLVYGAALQARDIYPGADCCVFLYSALGTHPPDAGPVTPGIEHGLLWGSTQVNNRVTDMWVPPFPVQIFYPLRAFWMTDLSVTAFEFILNCYLEEPD